MLATARPLVGAAGALVAVLIIDGMHYFQYTAVKFNHDVIQLPFWALAGYAFHAALKRGRVAPLAVARLRLRRRAVGEIFRRRAGGALRAVFVVRPAGAPGFGDARARGSALVVALLIAAPHVVWLFQTDFLPFAYASIAPPPVQRLVRSHPASRCFRRQPDILPAAVAVHRGGAVLSATEARSGHRRGSPTPSTAAS